MTRRRGRQVLSVMLATLVCGPMASGDVVLPSVLADHMVLQRDLPIPIWGKADPNERVAVRLGEQALSTQADQDGVWRVNLAPMAAGGPYELHITGNNTVVLHDVLIGEVWLCGGQSNMQWTLQPTNDSAAVIAAADYPQLRVFTARQTLAVRPQFTVPGAWQVCTPEVAGSFTAVGFHFGRVLHEELDVPVGLVNSSWGGSAAESWVDAETFASHPAYVLSIRKLQRQVAEFEANRATIEAEIAQAQARFQKALVDYQNDLATHDVGTVQHWERPDLNTDDWPTMPLPGAWDNRADPQLNGLDGVVWFRRTVDVPAAWAGQALTLSLGVIDDFDIAYFNGERVGGLGPETPNSWTLPRRYTVPGKLVRAGANVVAIRVADGYGLGGVTCVPAAMWLDRGDQRGDDAIALAGDWSYRVGARVTESLRPQRPNYLPQAGASFSTPCAMFNGMIAPLTPYGIRGAIWYQGESNANRAVAYRELLPLMIRSWRDAWGQGAFPFGIVQLANFMAAQPQPGDSAWAELRDAQLHAARTVDRAGLAVIIDVGDANDIHPRDKKTVGQRLALWALGTTYGRDLEYSGPIYRNMTIRDGKAVLAFDHVGPGLATAGDAPLGGFTIAGADGRFVWADARIDGDHVVVWSDAVQEPFAVRYGWADNPTTANLINRAGLPASPFRTDDWPLTTQGVW